MPALTSDIEVDLGAADSELGEIAARHPCLLPARTSEGVTLRGTFNVLDRGRTVDAFKVRIQLRPRGAFYLATVFETGGRIPRDIERHVNPADGSACVALPEDVLVTTEGKPLKLSAFLDGPVRDFLLAQAYFEREQRWPFGEHAHGTEGVLAFYAKLLGTRDLREVDRYLMFLEQPKLHRQWFCPCGSGQKVRRCHGARIVELRERITPFVAARLRHRLRSSMPAPT